MMALNKHMKDIIYYIIFRLPSINERISWDGNDALNIISSNKYKGSTSFSKEFKKIHKFRLVPYVFPVQVKFSIEVQFPVEFHLFS